jgi:hypothetical protein
MIWQSAVQGALFLLSIIIFGIIGYQRGWRREIVSLLFFIYSVWFVYLDVSIYLSRLLYQFLLGKSISDRYLLHSHANVVLFVTIASLVVIIAPGYVIGEKRISHNRKTLPQDHRLGLIPGIITGAVVAAELAFFLLPLWVHAWVINF